MTGCMLRPMSGLAFALTACAGWAQDGFVRILSPSDGTWMDRTALIQLVYEAGPGAGGDHLGLYIDGEEATMLLQWRHHHVGEKIASAQGPVTGYYPLINLKPGERTVCLRVVGKTHGPGGPSQCITVHVR
jgi:hypothetical protein